MEPLTKELALKRLKRYAKRWGGSIELVTDEVFNELDIVSAPFTSWNIGVDHQNLKVYHSPFCEPNDVAVYTTSLIHELGHCFASTQGPHESKEYAFFGWEVVLAKKVGLTLDDFCLGNNDYGIEDDGTDLGSLAKEAQYALLSTVVETAKASGLIVRGAPVSLRVL